MPSEAPSKEVSRAFLKPRISKFGGNDLASTLPQEAVRSTNQFLERISMVDASAPPAVFPWSFIFHNRMKSMQDILSASKAHRLVDFTEFALNVSDVALRPRHKEILRELNSYANSHICDLDNSLIGLQPSSLFLSEMAKAQAAAKSSTLKVSDLNFNSAPSLLDLIQSWAAVSDDHVIAENVRSLSSMVPDTMRVLTKGTLVLVKHNITTFVPFEGATITNALVFARVKDTSKAGEVVKVSVNPEENDTHVVDRLNVTVVPPALFTCINTSKSMEKFAVDQCDTVFQGTSSALTKKVDSQLECQGLDTTIIKKVIRQDMKNAEYKTLDCLIRQLADMCSNTDPSIVEFTDRADHTMRDFISRVKSGEIRIFPATKEIQLTQLSNINFRTLSNNILKSYLGACQGMLEGYQLQKKDLLNGSMKKNITDWYLKRIKDQVNVFLTSRNYDFSAVPTNYLEEMPSNLDTVRRNLEIIQSVLGAEKMKDELIQLVEGLMSEIYGKLDVYCDLMQSVLCEELNIPSDQFQVEEAQRKFESLPESKDITQGKGKLINDLLKDIKYTNRMKYLDKTPTEKVGIDVVPISGLIVGRLCRFENELKTVLQVWEKPKPAVSTTQLS
ncbi:hypothetical protein Pelo_14589 [Pelomyxa schiedti]|nr:hypothetical protein Pelo_14589 [Pelomyxa schiedti]